MIYRIPLNNSCIKLIKRIGERPEVFTETSTGDRSMASSSRQKCVNQPNAFCYAIFLWSIRRVSARKTDILSPIPLFLQQLDLSRTLKNSQFQFLRGLSLLKMKEVNMVRSTTGSSGSQNSQLIAWTT
ncbi:Hypothetical predicted protein [Podarcis lilfordi]|uniref:Uncharacterized protein n=1 Tax=Podarcis lilfordi TaxID=74358 RepID=A0AA35PH02_9SAUR|nr:Hypothetical predicted protein [Podarcis lilfordi]